jgi:hypothetical protein
MYASTPKYKTLQEVLTDQNLAALGDAYVNFIYSLALSERRREPTGAKVDNRILSQALKKAGLRQTLPKRTPRHKQADAAEALIVYAWMLNAVTIHEGVKILESFKDMVEAFCSLLLESRNKLAL